jgi:hypothetical protein
MKLDDPFDYQSKVGEPFQFRLVHVEHFLLRSRWAGYAVGAPEPTSVFVLLVHESHAEVADPFDPAAYVHVAWGMCFAEA